MQPLSKVTPKRIGMALSINGALDTRPKLAIKIAECIAESSQIETLVAHWVSLMFGLSADVTVAMYSALENRAAQLRMVEAACKETLPPKYFEIINAILIGFVRPAFRERDKLAHWFWAHSHELPDALLLMEPRLRMELNLTAIKGGMAQIDYDRVFVVREPDLIRMLERLTNATFKVMGANFIWDRALSDAKRDQRLQSLSSAPDFQAVLLRLRKNQKNTEEALQQSPPQDQPEKS